MHEIRESYAKAVANHKGNLWWLRSYRTLTAGQSCLIGQFFAKKRYVVAVWSSTDFIR